MCLTLKGYTYTDKEYENEDVMQDMDTEQVLGEDKDDEEDEDMCLDDEEEPLGLVWLYEMQVSIISNALAQMFSVHCCNQMCFMNLLCYTKRGKTCYWFDFWSLFSW